jgi:hypothetical protein
VSELCTRVFKRTSKIFSLSRIQRYRDNEAKESVRNLLFPTCIHSFQYSTKASSPKGGLFLFERFLSLLDKMINYGYNI